MLDIKLKLKLLLLLALCASAVGVGFGGGTASASCGKCDAIRDSNGQNIGYACIQAGRYHCVATGEGCDFPGRCDGGPGFVDDEGGDS